MSKSKEQYKNKRGEKRHEMSEGKKERMMEYGSMKTKNHGSVRKPC